MASDGGDERRPSPEALLALADRERRGHLKVWLGAAPGVGKTFAMLAAARAAARDGVDVVIGLAETHGRSETAALLEGLEQLPRRTIVYRGSALAEFDLDAALARRPAVLVVDELAHSNPPECRHPKRHQDVQELLDAGIDVWTALNIQHLESLSDVVSRITGVTVRETVPDTVLERADAVLLVDITPDELIQRLKDGKVYLPANARRAIDHFFKPGNLTALRELALRRTAARVDDQMVDYLRQNAIEGPWPTAERILVCVGGDAASETAIRAAGRLANGLNAGWLAVHVERPDVRVTAEETERTDEALRLAGRLGAEVRRPAGRDVVETILKLARRENITQIVIGRSRAGPIARLRGRSLTDAILAGAGDLAVQVVPGAAPPPRPRARPDLGRRLAGLSAPVAVASLAAVAGATGLALALARWIDLPNVSMVYLAAVVVCALRFGVSSAIAASILSFLAYNFFFIEPFHTFSVAKPHEFFALLVFLLVAVAIGGLAGRFRDQAELVRRRAASTRALHDFAGKLSGTARLDDLLWAVAAQVAGAVRGRCVVLLAEGRDLAIRGAAPPDDELGPAEWTAARWAFERGEAAGWRTETLPNARLQFRPLKTSRGSVGAVGYEPAAADRPLPAEDERVVEALIDQAAVAIERILLVEASNEAAAAAESERLRSALLSSISHDLRTPLAAILGAVTSLRTLGDRMPEAARADLLATIEEETRRLSRFVSDLLDMTSLEAGALDVAGDWIDAGDIVRDAVARAAQVLPRLRITTAIEPGRFVLAGNAVVTEQVLFNVLDNIDKYAGPSPRALIAVVGLDGRVRVTIEDDGPGVPADQLDRIFQKFHRVAPGDGRAAGTGLGLAIARGVVEAMGGRIVAESPVADGRGLRIVIEWPLAPPPPKKGSPP